ncbi:CGNR zinc finger domain-containing protein [Pseudonocardia sp. TRM90224]|uniref:CGNR zinc finger domain-containing protein n=1 Tax=Pseudonocardia sp. TRM90224 TaxID=2812678 RepID=UPI001E2C49D8|nr:CGNR zinc finger domain-containing protein [Pseudonocardia sp. TRM90224]
MDWRRYRSGRACIDLVHTGGGIPEHERFEIVRTPADLAAVLPHVLHEPDLRLTATAADLDALRVLRTASTRSALALAAGAEPAAADVETINLAAAEPPLVRAFAAGGGTRLVAPTTPQAIATLACDAVDLFGGPLRGRIRVCAADDCGLLLVDTSRPGNRRWCSMRRCGNLAKVRRSRANERDTG